MVKQATKPIEDTIAGECMAVRLRMLNRAVTNIYDEALRPLGIRSGQLTILVVTARAGTAQPAEMCKRLLLDPSTLSRNVERMKAKGWLENVEGDDGRAQPFRLTAKGKRLLEKVSPAWETAQEQAESLLGKQACVLIDKASMRARNAEE